jgi:hypothetical protein
LRGDPEADDRADFPNLVAGLFPGVFDANIDSRILGEHGRIRGDSASA